MYIQHQVSTKVVQLRETTLRKIALFLGVNVNASMVFSGTCMTLTFHHMV